MKSFLNEEPVETEAYALPDLSDAGNSYQAYIFGSTYGNTLPLPLPLDQIPLYWQLYKENCDRLVKVLHIPTIEPLILQAATQPNGISKRLETLINAVFFSAVVSLSPAECLQFLGYEKQTLVRQYKYSTEQALARASFLETEEMMVLQAFVIFLTSLRTHCSTRLIWTLTALAVRIAQNAGIHRDGTHFNLPPFQVEMRRRLWWNICILDSRASEDCGYDPAIRTNSVSTQMPLNVNDDDLFPNMKKFPRPRIGYTEMTCSLVRFEGARSFPRLHYVGLVGTSQADSNLQARKQLTENGAWIKACQERLEKLCLRHSDLTDPFQWYIAAISRIVLIKMWLVAYQPHLRRNNCIILPEKTKDRLFIAAIENLEYWLLLNSDKRTSRWAWLCETYVQWYALTFLLQELCTRTQGEIVDRAWIAVNAALKFGLKSLPGSSWESNNGLDPGLNLIEAHCDAYKPLSGLLSKASSARARALAQDENGSDSQDSGFMQPAANSQVPTLGFQSGKSSLPYLGFNHFSPESCIANTETLDLLQHHLENWEPTNEEEQVLETSYAESNNDPSAWTAWQAYPEAYGLGPGNTIW